MLKRTMREKLWGTRHFVRFCCSYETVAINTILATGELARRAFDVPKTARLVGSSARRRLTRRFDDGYTGSKTSGTGKSLRQHIGVPEPLRDLSSNRLMRVLPYESTVATASSHIPGTGESDKSAGFSVRAGAGASVSGTSEAAFGDGVAGVMIGSGVYVAGAWDTVPVTGVVGTTVGTMIDGWDVGADTTGLKVAV